jgi:hypothetical protein
MPGAATYAGNSPRCFGRTSNPYGRFRLDMDRRPDLAANRISDVVSVYLMSSSGGTYLSAEIANAEQGLSNAMGSPGQALLGGGAPARENMNWELA